MTIHSACPFCPGPSALLGHQSHDPSCPYRRRPTTHTDQQPTRSVNGDNQ